MKQTEQKIMNAIYEAIQNANTNGDFVPCDVVALLEDERTIIISTERADFEITIKGASNE